MGERSEAADRRAASADGGGESSGRRLWWFPADDRGLGVVGLVIGVGTFLLAGQQATASSALIPGSGHAVIQGTFYPRVVSVLVTVSSVVLIAIESIRIRRGGEIEKWMLGKLPLRVVVGSFGLLAAVAVGALALETLGFMIPTAILSVALARWFGAPSWLKAGVAGVVISVVVYLLFTYVFQSPLPPTPGLDL